MSKTMNRLLAALPIAAVFATAVHAQCLPGATGTSVGTTGFVPWNSVVGYTSTFPVGDEGITNPPIALTAMPNFPMAGAVGNLDRLWVNSNGEVYLTDSTLGLAAPVGGIQYGCTDLAEMRGTAVANSSARICAFGGDNDPSNVAGAVWSITVDQSVPGQVRICWTDLARLGNTTDRFSFDCTLFSSGAVSFSYSPTIPGAIRLVGVSAGSSAGTATSPSRDLLAGADSGTEALLYQAFDATGFSLANKSILISPNGVGGYTSSMLCSNAFHATYGAGCYGPEARSSFGQQFGDSATASPVLTGNAMTLFPSATGYAPIWLPAAAATLYLPPSGTATSLPVSDDGSHTIVPSVGVPSPFGVANQVTISHNGIVSFAATANNPNDWSPTLAELAGAVPGAGFYTWHDYDDTATGSGRIKHEEVGGVLYITWDNVEGYLAGANPHTFQFQIDLATGTVSYVWVSVNPVSYTPRDYVVGYTDPGVSITPPSISLPTGLPVVTGPDVVLSPLTLSVSGSPVFTPGGSTGPVSWTVSNIPDVAPPAGVGLCFLMFSVAPIPGGFDATILGMPNCNIYVLTIDVLLGMNGAVGTDTLTFPVPQPLSPGLSFYAQALALFPPNSLPNGQNAFGGLLSNGARTYFNTF